MIPKAEFKAALQIVLNSTSKDADKAALTNILCEFETGLLRLVGTDGHRVSVVEIACEQIPPGDSHLLYRGYAEKLLKTLLVDKKPTGNIYVCTYDTAMIFTDDAGGAESFDQPGGEIEYPDYRQSLKQPDAPPESVTLDSRYILTALKDFEPLQTDRRGVEIKLFDGGPNYFTPRLNPELKSIKSAFTAIMGFRS